MGQQGNNQANTHTIDLKGADCRNLELPAQWWHDLVDEHGEEEAYHKAVDDVLEAYSANPVW
jgi:hypothetical protein